MRVRPRVRDRHDDAAPPAGGRIVIASCVPVLQVVAQARQLGLQRRRHPVAELREVLLGQVALGENSRVLEWIVGRLEGGADAVETPIGLLPASDSLDLDGLEITDDALEQLFDVDRDSWLAECDLTEEYFAQFGDRVPAALKAELSSLRYHLQHQHA